jgi:16S rRNA (guanine966-N2)-methyltransferase
VERDRRAVTVIGANLARAGLAERATVVTADAIAFLAAGASPGGGPFGAVLVDPPYGDGTLVAALERLAEPSGPWLAEDGVVVAKYFWRDAPPDAIGRLVATRARRFGETALTYYVRAGR